MSESCSEINCKARKGPSGISFHRFPHKYSDLLSKWVHAMKRKDWAPTEHSSLCSNHFDESCFVVRPGKCGRRLYDHAVPTKFTCGKSYLDKPHTKSETSKKEALQKNPQLNCCSRSFLYKHKYMFQRSVILKEKSKTCKTCWERKAANCRWTTHYWSIILLEWQRVVWKSNKKDWKGSLWLWI